MNNETVFRAEINLNGENDFYVQPIFFKFWHKFKLIFFSGINLRKLAVLHVNILIVTHSIQKFGLRRHLSALYSGEIVNQVSKSGQLNKEKQKKQLIS